MISTRKMLQNTSRSFIHKYSLIAIMAEYISRLSAIVMQLVREFQVTAIDFENFIRLTHFGIAYWFFSPAEKLRILVFFIFFSPLPLSVRVLLNVESAKHEIQFSKWYKKRNPIAQPLFSRAFVFVWSTKIAFQREGNFQFPSWDLLFLCDIFPQLALSGTAVWVEAKTLQNLLSIDVGGIATGNTHHWRALFIAKASHLDSWKPERLKRHLWQ